MKTDLSLQNLAVELERRATAKQDFVVNTKAAEMVIETGKVPTINFRNGVDHSFKPNDIAHRQIAARLEIPAKYYDRMRDESPVLLADNVNHWFKRQPENRMIRTLDGGMRAFLSDRYQRIENEEIAQTVLPILLEQDGVQVVSSSITETRMYIKAVFSKVQGEVQKGDVVQAGVVISNSEVGHGAVKIEPLVYRLVCLNGLIVPDAKFSAHHLGGRVSAGDGVFEMLTDETIKADDKAILLKVRDVVRGSFNQVRFQSHIDAMRLTTERKLEGNPAEAVKLLAKRHQLNEFEEGGVLRHLIQGGDITQWGLLNAVTRTAQDVASYDRATELEALGGVIMAMPANDWKPLALAA